MADPLEIILGNSNLDIVRGRSKLYLQADDLLDLKWPDIDSAALLSETTRDQAIEASRNRAHDSGLQVTDNTENLITSSDDENPATDQAAEQVDTQIAEPPAAEPIAAQESVRPVRIRRPNQRIFSKDFITDPEGTSTCNSADPMANMSF
jgi:hypothetical protein